MMLFQHIESINMEKNRWWGYVHVNGNIQVKRFFDKRDIDDARESPFCKYIFDPFESKDRDSAINIIKERINSK